jgi:hypothetical protein
MIDHWELEKKEKEKGPIDATMMMMMTHHDIIMGIILGNLHYQKSNRDNILYGMLRWSSSPSHESTLDFGIICW